MAKLDDAFANLYEAFADVQRPTRIDGCPCCTTETELQVLTTTPRHELDSETLFQYSFNAVWTVGTLEDLLWFLPRILEVDSEDLTQRGFTHNDIEVLGERVAMTNVDAWPAGRSAAFIDVLVSLIHAAGLDGSRVDSLVCFAGMSGVDMKPILRAVEVEPARLVAFQQRNAASIVTKRLSNEFWKLPNPAHDLIVEWLNSPAIEGKIRAAGQR